MKRQIILIAATAVLSHCLHGTQSIRAEAQVEEQVEVFHEAGKFAGWPANHGVWSWENEILVGFEIGTFKKKKRGHAIDYSKPARHVLGRSLDGGKTWGIEEPEGLRPPAGTKVADVPTLSNDRPLTDCPGGIDFTRPGFALTARMSDVDAGQSSFYYTLDRGKNWMGPFRVPNFGHPGTAARTDYLINGKHDLTMFLTVPKSNGEEGRVVCVRTRDGARTWAVQGYVCPEPDEKDYAIMPSSVQLSSGRIITAVRYRDFIDLYTSDDQGKAWTRLGRAADRTGGNPPSMIQLRDGRLVITYGYRNRPYGIRARISSDDGKTWGDEIVLRADGGSSDLGYPRTVQRPDGKLVTMYYFNTDRDRERFIGATIWDPGTK